MNQQARCTVKPTAPALGGYVSNADLLNFLETYLKEVGRILESLETKPEPMFSNNNLLISLIPDLRRRFTPLEAEHSAASRENECGF